MVAVTLALPRVLHPAIVPEPAGRLEGAPRPTLVRRHGLLPQRVPVLVWARAAAPAAERQLRLLASQPYVVGHVAAMPDVHVASGVAVGTVFATRDHAVPAALGGDLGCGVAAQRFDLSAAALSRGDLRVVLATLARLVPVGDACHAGDGIPVPDVLREAALSTRALCRERAYLGPRHLGTLGGGNHFVELDRAPDGALWALVHTGSRGLGAAIRAHHVRACGPGDLAALQVSQASGRAYLDDVAWAIAYAAANRAVILARVAETLSAFGAAPDGDALDVPHNTLQREIHFGEPLLVHRKGAVRADAGSVVIVPGSMGTASWLGRGLGLAAALCSCSHGAGRVLSRKEARGRIHPRALEQAMRRVVFDERRAPDLVEEAPGAYRDIAAVMEDQRELVSATTRLVPVAVLKG